eukprot:7310784-Pyramimonas_sp.AAC.1
MTHPRVTGAGCPMAATTYPMSGMSKRCLSQVRLLRLSFGSGPRLESYPPPPQPPSPNQGR